ncbi:hypothetical protein FOA43_001883 [Brettanomyces nanus]|uniref:Sodium/calcium exchanger membrane region domain-containing protein n=1 Tax=Eeniella nana TaxID=13502 RepID=A0A875S3B5_EENNA|nr:uncharacterized protein FOA43_001883 [Brettanomyces nanus]QPG74552.1 hypothetical protein FOA43_001883 [Brettanomyces nanus]
MLGPISLPIAYGVSIFTLFVLLGLLASDYLTPNLTYLAALFHLDEKMAGITLLALANGAPDISSTYAAMRSNSTSLAIGELLGSANFELTMVIGCMALVKPFTVQYSNVLKDLVIFAVLILLSLMFLSDGKITLVESILMLGLTYKLTLSDSLKFGHFYLSIFEPVSSIAGFISVLDLISKSAFIIVAILKDVAATYNIKESLLGITVLSLGNSIGDLITNVTLASLGLSLTGLHACFGSPLLYILFGVGFNSLIVRLTNSGEPIHFEIDSNLKVTAYSILFTLLFYMIAIPAMGWKVNRFIGSVVVLIWVSVTAYNAYNG